MTTRVLRYQIIPNDREPTRIELPVGARVLSVDIKSRDHFVSLWALCPEAHDVRVHTFWCVGTGWDMPAPDISKLEFIGTAVERLSATVWHVFEDHS